MPEPLSALISKETNAAAAAAALVIKDAQVLSPIPHSRPLRQFQRRENGSPQFGKWKEAVPDCRLRLYPHLDPIDSAKGCTDLTSPGISGSSSGQAGPVVAIRGGGWRVQSIHEEDGDPVEIVLTRGGFTAGSSRTSRAGNPISERSGRGGGRALHAISEVHPGRSPTKKRQSPRNRRELSPQKRLPKRAVRPGRSLLRNAVRGPKKKENDMGKSGDYDIFPVEELIHTSPG